MRSRVKTGDVFQIRRNGPNYVSLGKVRDGEGQEFIAATRNGNITYDGKMKTGRGEQKPKIHVLKGDDVRRVHGTRHVDMESVIGHSGRVARHLSRTTSSTGVATNAPNIAAQLSDLVSTL